MPDVSDVVRVAVFPCGSEVGLEIHAALRFEKNLELHGLSSAPCHGQAIYAHYDSSMPWIQDPAFLDRFNAYLKAHGVDFVFPAYDDVLVFLSEHRDRLAAKLVAPDMEVCRIARVKSLTYKALGDADFLPAVYETPEEATSWPVFSKPDRGQGSQGVALIRDAEAFRAAQAQATTPRIFCEYLPGEEYTVDCFSDRHGALLFSRPRERERVKAGISVRSRSLPATSEIEAVAARIQSVLPFRGAWFFQVKRAADGKLKLLEVAPRVGGCMGLSRNLGANLPLLSLFDQMGLDVAVTVNEGDLTVERHFANRYVGVRDFQRVYVDYDDTLTCGDLTNSFMLGFLHHCRNRKAEVHLITRHAGDIRADLSRRAIAPDLFASILHIRDGSPKSAHIAEPRGAVFIDDSFRERAEVARVHGIPVYGVDAVESLIDWRKP